MRDAWVYHQRGMLDEQIILAHQYRTARQFDRAIALMELIVGATSWVFGPDHHDTVTAKGDLAAFMRAAGYADDASRVISAGPVVYPARMSPDR